MKSLITGINGSGPSYMAEYLVDVPNMEVHGIARWHTNGSNKNLENIKDGIFLHECDLTDLSSTIRVLDEVRPDYIFHMASHANVRLCFVNPIAVLKNNVDSTINLLEAIRILKLPTIVHYAGTSEVYGQVRKEDTPIVETHRLDPVNVYAISKLTQEKLVKSYYCSYGIKCVITRAFTYINPRRPDIFSSAFARQLVEVEKGKRDKITYGNLDSTRTLMDVRDTADAYWVSANMCNYGEEYNIGGTDVLTVGDFLKELLSYSILPDVPHEQDPKLLRPVDVTMQIPNIDKFVNKTSWKPKYKLSDSVQFLLDYYRKIV